MDARDGLRWEGFNDYTWKKKWVEMLKPDDDDQRKEVFGGRPKATRERWDGENWEDFDGGFYYLMRIKD